MKKYLIKYSFEGDGEMIVKAKNKEEAEDIFYDGGDIQSDKEGGQDYMIQTAEEIKE